MLTLNRRPHEAVIVTCPDGTKFVITLLMIDGNQVKMGFDAPKTVVIDRYEVHHRKARLAAGIPLRGQEPRGPDWIDYRERQQRTSGCPHCDGFYDEAGTLLHANGCIAL